MIRIGYMELIISPLKDGDVFLARPARSEPCQADDDFLPALLGGADVQRAARGALQGIQVQQLLPGAAADDAVLVRAARQFRHRLAGAFVALRPLFAAQTHLPHPHEEHQGRNTRVRFSFYSGFLLP